MSPDDDVRPLGTRAGFPADCALDCRISGELLTRPGAQQIIEHLRRIDLFAVNKLR